MSEHGVWKLEKVSEERRCYGLVSRVCRCGGGSDGGGEG